MTGWTGRRRRGMHASRQSRWLTRSMAEAVGTACSRVAMEMGPRVDMGVACSSREDMAVACSRVDMVVVVDLAGPNRVALVALSRVAMVVPREDMVDHSREDMEASRVATAARVAMAAATRSFQISRFFHLLILIFASSLVAELASFLVAEDRTQRACFIFYCGA